MIDLVEGDVLEKRDEINWREVGWVRIPSSHVGKVIKASCIYDYRRPSNSVCKVIVDSKLLYIIKDVQCKVFSQLAEYKIKELPSERGQYNIYSNDLYKIFPKDIAKAIHEKCKKEGNYTPATNQTKRGFIPLEDGETVSIYKCADEIVVTISKSVSSVHKNRLEEIGSAIKTLLQELRS